MISVRCGNCGKVYQLAEALAGKRVRCKGCGAAISVPAADDLFGAVEADAPVSGDWQPAAFPAAQYGLTKPSQSSSTALKITGAVGIACVVLLTLILGVAYVRHAWTLQHATPVSARRAPFARPARSIQASAEEPAKPEPPAAPPPDWNAVPRTPANEPPKKAPLHGRLASDGQPIAPPPVDVADTAASFDQPAGKDAEQEKLVASIFRENSESRRGGEFRSIVAGPVASPWFAVREARDDSWSRYDATNLAAPVSTLHMEDKGFPSEPVVNADATWFVRSVDFGSGRKIQIRSFDESKPLREIDAKGLDAILTFVNHDIFLVSSNRTLVLVNAKTAQKVHELVLPAGASLADAGRPSGVSADGRSIAVPVDIQSMPVVLVYSLDGSLEHRIAPSLPGTDPHERFHGFLTPQGAAFSPDGRRLAALYKHDGQHLLYVIDVPLRKVMQTYAYPDLEASLHRGLARTRHLAWLDGDCVTVFGAAVVDTATGRVVGRTVDDLSFMHDVGGGQYLLTTGMMGQVPRVVTVDSAALKQRVAAAHAAGAIASASADAPVAHFAIAGVVPKGNEAKLGAAPDPAPPVAAFAPVALRGAYEQLRDVLFTHAGPPAIIVSSGPGPLRQRERDLEYNPLRDAAELTVDRIDLTSGRSTATLKLPGAEQLLAASPDGSLLVIAESSGRAGAIVQVVHFASGKPVARFAPYTDVKSPRLRHDVTWAAMTDADTLLTLDESNTLVGWSLSAHRAAWIREGVRGEPVFTPGFKRLLAPTQGPLVVIDPKTGDAVGSLAAGPAEAFSHAAFSADGQTFYAATKTGLYRWNVKTGAAAEPVSNASFDSFSVQGDFILNGDDLFDVNQKAFVFRYPVAGRHLVDAPAGRHWFVARTPQGPVLASAQVPSAEDRALIARLAANPPLVHPGRQISLQVSAGAATAEVNQALLARLAQRHVNEGESVATLRVSAQQVASRPITIRFINRGLRTEQATVPIYDCFYELVDNAGKVLYGSQTQRIDGFVGGMLDVKKDQSTQSAVDEQAARQLGFWAKGIYVPDFLTADGKVPDKPQRVLSVEDLRGG